MEGINNLTARLQIHIFSVDMGFGGLHTKSIKASNSNFTYLRRSFWTSDGNSLSTSQSSLSDINKKARAFRAMSKASYKQASIEVGNLCELVSRAFSIASWYSSGKSSSSWVGQYTKASRYYWAFVTNFSGNLSIAFYCINCLTSMC